MNTGNVYLNNVNTEFDLNQAADSPDDDNVIDVTALDDALAGRPMRKEGRYQLFQRKYY